MLNEGRRISNASGQANLSVQLLFIDLLLFNVIDNHWREHAEFGRIDWYDEEGGKALAYIVSNLKAW